MKWLVSDQVVQDQLAQTPKAEAPEPTFWDHFGAAMQRYGQVQQAQYEGPAVDVGRALQHSVAGAIDEVTSPGFAQSVVKRFGSQLNETLAVSNITGEQYLTKGALQSVVDAVNRYRPKDDPVYNPLGPEIGAWGFLRNPKIPMSSFDGYATLWRAVDDLKKANPGAAANIPGNDAELHAQVQQSQRGILAESERERQTAGPIANILGDLGGGGAGSFADPLNLAFMAMGGPASKTLLGTFLREGALNTAADAVAMPDRIDRLEKLGVSKPGAAQVTGELAGDFLLGGALPLAVKGVGVGLQRADEALGSPVAMSARDLVEAFDKRFPSPGEDVRAARNHLAELARHEEDSPYAPTDGGLAEFKQNLLATSVAIDNRMAVPNFRRLVEGDARFGERLARPEDLPVPPPPADLTPEARAKLVADFGAPSFESAPLALQRLDLAQQIAEEPKTLVDTRGMGQMFHGTSSEIKGLSDYYGSDLNYYGSGFYTTDAVDIARGYTRKGRGDTPTIYQVSEKAPQKLYDMEAPISQDLRKSLEGIGGSDGLVAQALDEEPKNLRELYDTMREISRSEMMTASEVQENFDSIAYHLEQQGYTGLQHVGGLRTNKKPHLVRIYWKPSDAVSIKKAGFDLSRLDIPSLPQGASVAGVSDHGPVVTGLDNRWSDAVSWMRQAHTGDAVGVLSHPEVPSPIDVVWGNRDHGLQKILEKHPEVAADLPDRLAKMHVFRKGPNRIELEDGKGPGSTAAIVRLDYDKARKTWLLTAFERGQSPAGLTEGGKGLGASDPGSPKQLAGATISTPLPESKTTPAKPGEPPVKEQLRKTFGAAAPEIEALQKLPSDMEIPAQDHLAIFGQNSGPVKMREVRQRLEREAGMVESLRGCLKGGA